MFSRRFWLKSGNFGAAASLGTRPEPGWMGFSQKVSEGCLVMFQHFFSPAMSYRSLFGLKVIFFSLAIFAVGDKSFHVVFGLNRAILVLPQLPAPALNLDGRVFSKRVEGVPGDVSTLFSPSMSYSECFWP